MHTTVHGDPEPKTQLAIEMNDNAVNATRSSRAREDTTGNGGISVVLRHNDRESGGLTAC